DGAVKELRGRGVEANPLMLQGDARSVILDRAKEAQADLVFVGSNGASALAKYFLGRVAASVVSHAPCSVEIVRIREGKLPGVRKILLATDGSEFSERAARGPRTPLRRRNPPPAAHRRHHRPRTRTGPPRHPLPRPPPAAPPPRRG